MPWGARLYNAPVRLYDRRAFANFSCTIRSHRAYATEPRTPVVFRELLFALYHQRRVAVDLFPRKSVLGFQQAYQSGPEDCLSGGSGPLLRRAFRPIRMTKADVFGANAAGAVYDFPFCPEIGFLAGAIRGCRSGSSGLRIEGRLRWIATGGRTITLSNALRSKGISGHR